MLDLTFSKLIAFPDVPVSLFDAAVCGKAIEVQIKSVFSTYERTQPYTDWM